MAPFLILVIAATGVFMVVICIRLDRAQMVRVELFNVLDRAMAVQQTDVSLIEEIRLGIGYLGDRRIAKTVRTATERGIQTSRAYITSICDRHAE